MAGEAIAPTRTCSVAGRSAEGGGIAGRVRSQSTSPGALQLLREGESSSDTPSIRSFSWHGRGSVPALPASPG
eukprot:5870429-Amphidinium_carterae.1